DSAGLPNIDTSYDRQRCVRTDGARQDMLEGRFRQAVGGKDSLIDELLTDGLIARDLMEHTVIEIRATVTYLHDIHPWPDNDAQCESRGHLTAIMALRRL